MGVFRLMTGAAMLYKHSCIMPNSLTNMAPSAPTGNFRVFLHFCLVLTGSQHSLTQVNSKTETNGIGSSGPRSHCVTLYLGPFQRQGCSLVAIAPTVQSSPIPQLCWSLVTGRRLMHYNVTISFLHQLDQIFKLQMALSYSLNKYLNHHGNRSDSSPGASLERVLV